MRAQGPRGCILSDTTRHLLRQKITLRPAATRCIRFPSEAAEAPSQSPPSVSALHSSCPPPRRLFCTLRLCPCLNTPSSKLSSTPPLPPLKSNLHFHTSPFPPFPSSRFATTTGRHNRFANPFNPSKHLPANSAAAGPVPPRRGRLPSRFRRRTSESLGSPPAGSARGSGRRFLSSTPESLGLRRRVRGRVRALRSGPRPRRAPERSARQRRPTAVLSRRRSEQNMSVRRISAWRSARRLRSAAAAAANRARVSRRRTQGLPPPPQLEPPGPAAGRRRQAPHQTPSRAATRGGVAAPYTSSPCLGPRRAEPPERDSTCRRATTLDSLHNRAATLQGSNPCWVVTRLLDKARAAGDSYGKVADTAGRLSLVPRAAVVPRAAESARTGPAGCLRGRLGGSGVAVSLRRLRVPRAQASLCASCVWGEGALVSPPSPCCGSRGLELWGAAAPPRVAALQGSSPLVGALFNHH